MKKSKRRSRAFWTRLVAEYEQNPGPKREFAVRHGVNAGTFESWFYRLRREGRAVPSENPEIRLVEVNLPPARVSHSVEATPPVIAGQVEALLPSGISLRFDTNVPPRYLGELIAAMEGGIRC